MISIKKINEGQHFGEISFFSGLSGIINIKSLNFTTMLIVKRSEFLEMLHNFPDDY